MDDATISRFKGEYAWLSNMYVFSGFVYGNLHFNSVENFYQAMKTTDWSYRQEISQMNPYEAKRFARSLRLRDDWETVKDEVMLYGLRMKFNEPHLANRLLSTKGRLLVEGNEHGDVYWGVCNGTGLNRLGVLLMQVRAELEEGCA